MNAVLAREAPVCFSPLAVALPLVPHLPTITEPSFPGCEASSWYAQLMSSKTPGEVVVSATIRSAAVTVLKNPIVNKGLLALRYLIVGSTPQWFGSFIQGKIARQAKNVRALNLSAN